MNDETNQSVKSERHNYVGIIGDNSSMCRGMVEAFSDCGASDIHLHIVDVSCVRRSNGRTEHLVDKTRKGAEKVKKSFKSLIIVLIIVMCIVVLAGCVTRSRMIDKPTNVLAIRTTDGNLITYDKRQIKNISENRDVIMLTIDWQGNGQTETIVFNKENITYVAYA